MTGHNSTVRLFFLYYIPSILWASIIFHASSYPAATVSEVYWQELVIKKCAHVFVYSILTLLNYRALKKSSINAKTSGILAVIITLLYGISDEIHQGFTPTREPTLRDAIIDTIAGIGIITILWKYSQKMPPKLQLLGKKLELL